MTDEDRLAMLALIERVVERYPDGTMMLRVTYTLANGAVGMKEVIAARVDDTLAVWPTEDAQQPVESTIWATGSFTKQQQKELEALMRAEAEAYILMYT